ncbi:hypothetical protein [Paenibacillus xylanexedens]|uniref:hypothetical protein n=1 Tax=Paenibacillus xylanexedens TaxID=528191 RepID=UPI0011A4B3C3|nr:hypothetical protein [Paenibacillus xylanexedens]
MRDAETGDPVTWSEVFFYLHKHCNLDKWQIRSYTYPQIQALLAQVHKYIRFEVEITQAPLRAMFGGGEKSDGKQPDGYNDTDYHEIDEDGVMALARAFGGG